MFCILFPTVLRPHESQAAGSGDHPLDNATNPCQTKSFLFFSGVKKEYAYKMVSADFEHASFNILCCVVKKKKETKKNPRYLWNAFKLCCSVVNNLFWARARRTF